MISVLNENGMSVEDDPIIGQSVSVDFNGDLDVACQFHSMLFGMKLRIESGGGGNINAFYSDWTPSIIVQYLKGTTEHRLDRCWGINRPSTAPTSCGKWQSCVEDQCSFI